MANFGSDENLRRLNYGYRVKIHARQYKHEWRYELRWWNGKLRKDFRIPLHTQDLETALRNRERYEQQITPAIRRPPPAPTDHRLSEFITFYLDNCRARRLARQTIGSYQWILRSLLRYTGELPISTLGRDQVKSYIEGRIVAGMRPSGLNDVLRTIRVAFNWAVEQGMLTSNPAQGIKPVREPRRVARPFTAGEFKAIIEQINRSDDLAIALTLILTGMRISEVLSLRWTDLDPALTRAYIRGKGGHEREVPVCELLRETLKGLDRDFELVIPGVPRGTKSPSVLAKRFRSYLRQAGCAGRGTFHRFRYTTASALVNMGFTNYDVGLYLGHSIQGVTDRYIRVDSERLRQIAVAIQEWVKKSLSGQLWTDGDYK